MFSFSTMSVATGSDEIDSRTHLPKEQPPRSALALVAAALREGHAEIRESVLRLKELCTSLRRNEVSVDPSPVVLIEEFGGLLIPHFAAEEVEKFFGSSVTEEPQLLRLVEGLEAEHKDMLEALDRLVVFANDGPQPADLAARLANFLHWVEAHEHAENALMQEFLLRDEDGNA